MQKKEVAKLDDSSVKAFENDPLKELVKTLEGENNKLKIDLTQYQKTIDDLKNELTTARTDVASLKAISATNAMVN